MAPWKHVDDWFRDAAGIEATTPITIGATDIESESRIVVKDGTERLALAKLVELRRRQHGLSVEDLATCADIALEDVVRIERGKGSILEPRAMQQIARVLKLPERRLLELAGIEEVKDIRFQEATVRFAARSEPIVELRPEELEALVEYVKVLVESQATRPA